MSPTSLISNEVASWAVEDVVNSCSPSRMQGCDLGITRVWKKMAVDRLQVQPMTKSVAKTVTKVFLLHITHFCLKKKVFLHGQKVKQTNKKKTKQKLSTNHLQFIGLSLEESVQKVKNVVRFTIHKPQRFIWNMA